MAGAEFGVLGPVLVRCASAETGLMAECRVPSGRALGTLAVLLVAAGRPVSVDQIVEYVWADAAPARPKAALHTTLSRLRQALPDPVAARIRPLPGGYAFDVGPGELDLVRFEAGYAAGRAAADAGDHRAAVAELRAALALWRGGLAAGAGVDALVRDAGPRLRELRWDAAARIADAELALGNHEALVPELRRLVRGDPLNERFQALLLTALDRSGRRADALAAYRDARAAMARDLGVEPGAELRDLHQRILAGEGGPAAPAAAAPIIVEPPRIPAQLPADVADFTGRAPDVSRVLAEVRGAPAGAVPVVVVTGPGGIGKTTLAVHAAHLLRQDFPGGQLYAELRTAAAPVDPTAVLAAFLTELGVPAGEVPADPARRAALFRTVTSGRRLLVVADDAADAAQVAPLVPGDASCAVLVTCRTRLADLDGVRHVRLDLLDPAAARDLLDRAAGPERVAAEPDEAARLVAFCAGLPLALRVVGARLASRPEWPLRRLADRLDGRSARLDELRHGNRAVRTAFAEAYAGLALIAEGAVAARVFRLLAVWPGPPLPAAAAAVLAGIEEAAAQEALDVLLDAHLVRWRDDRYGLHDLARLYAEELLDAQDPAAEAVPARDRLARWLVAMTTGAGAAVLPSRYSLPLEGDYKEAATIVSWKPEPAARWLADHWPLIEAAVPWAASWDGDYPAWRLTAAVSSWLGMTERWAEWHELHLAALDRVRRQGHVAGEGWVVNNLGISARKLGRVDEALAFLDVALDIRRRHGDAAGQVATLGNLTALAEALGRPEAGFGYAQEALKLQRSLGGDPGRQAMTLNNMAANLRALGRLTEAVDCLTEAAGIHRRFPGDGYGAGLVQQQLGEILSDLGRLDEALTAFRAAVGLRAGMGNRHGAGESRYGAALALWRLGRLPEARRGLAEALDILGDFESPVTAEAEETARRWGTTGPPAGIGGRPGRAVDGASGRTPDRPDAGSGGAPAGQAQTQTLPDEPSTVQPSAQAHAS